MKIHEVMLARKISQRKLSIMAGITSQDLNQALHGKKPFFPAWRKRVSTALDVPEDELFPEYRRK
jgi:hypothetical protein